MERLFPDVPAWWTFVRFLALGAGVWFVGRRIAPPVLRGDESIVFSGRFSDFIYDSLPEHRSRGARPALERGSAVDSAPRGPSETLTLAYAGVLVLTAFVLDRAGILLQWGYLISAFVPAMYFAIGPHARLIKPSAEPRRNQFSTHTVIAMAVIVALWLLVWVPWAWRSPWIANFGDALGQFDALLASQTGEFNLWTDSLRPGSSALHLLFYGAGLHEFFGTMPTLASMQALNILWTFVAALTMGIAVGRLIGEETSAVATATVLFSPLGMVATLCPVVVFTGPLFMAVLLLESERVLAGRSIAALFAMGTTAGIAATSPILFLPSTALFLATCVFARRSNDHSSVVASRTAVITAVLLFVAVMVPTLLKLDEATTAFAYYSGGFGQWSAIEASQLGQIPSELARYQMHSGDPGRFDAIVGTLLLPFQTPRTAIRYFADSLFTPAGLVLAALGAIFCLRSRTSTSKAVLLFWALSVSTGTLTSYDRPSIIRVLGVCGPWALLAAIGCAGLAGGTHSPRMRRAVVLSCALSVALSGLILGIVVHPRTIAKSAAGLALESLTDASFGQAAIITGTGKDRTGTSRFATGLPEIPLALLPFPAETGNDADLLAKLPPIVFFDPGSEDVLSVSERICAEQPERNILTIRDHLDRSRVFVAVASGYAWEPAVESGRWSAGSCATPPLTERVRARQAIAAAADMSSTTGRLLGFDAVSSLGDNVPPAAAVERLRAAAARSFLQVELYVRLARLLLEYPALARSAGEATAWAERATNASGWCLPDAIEVLIAAHDVRDDHQAADAVRERAAHEELAECRHLPPEHPFRQPVGPWPP